MKLPHRLWCGSHSGASARRTATGILLELLWPPPGALPWRVMRNNYISLIYNQRGPLGTH